MEGAATTWATVLALTAESTAAVAVMVQRPGTAGAVQTPAGVMAPAEADHSTAVLGVPLTVAVKVVAVETVRTGFAGATGVIETGLTVTVACRVAVLPAGLVTVSV
jgi:hypothetical protein